MPRKPEANGRELAASAISQSATAAGRSVDAKSAVISAFALERRGGWTVSRRSNRPINLERRARFARIETA